MQKAVIVFCLCFFPFAFVYSQSKIELDCKSNLESVLKTNDLKNKYEMVQYIYEKPYMFKDDWSHYIELIRGYLLLEEEKKTVFLAEEEEEEIDRYIELLNCTPEHALDEYKGLIRKIKSEKEIYLKCIDAELAKGDSSEYAKPILFYGFLPPHWSLMPPWWSKLDYLKFFKEFIFNRNENVLPEVKSIIRYKSGLTDEDIIALSQKTAAKATNLLRERIKDFDRECFLIGTLDDNMGHYQTFTANKSIDDVDNNIKWMFDSKFMPDTMAYQRITAYETKNDETLRKSEVLALIVSSLFKEDYPDFRALRVCTCTHCYPPLRNLYGSEIKSHYDPEDSICKKTPFKIELYSSSLAQITASYYDFDYKKRLLPVTSSGGDIAYRGVLNKEKISTQAQKLSFLAGVFMRYGCGTVNYYNYRVIPVSNSLSLAAVCSEILKETGCEHVDYIDKIPDGHKIVFAPSSEVWELMLLIHKVNEEMNGCYLRYFLKSNKDNKG